MNPEGNLKKNSEVLVFFADGFEEIEAIGAVDILRRGGLDVATVSPRWTIKTASRHISARQCA